MKSLNFSPVNRSAFRLSPFKLSSAIVLAASLLATPILAHNAAAKTFRYAFQGDLNALDPYTLDETFTIGALGNVFEGLTKRDKDLKIIPGLATSWEVMEPTRWRFHLRKGVKFHDGEDFTADDVVFSCERAMSGGSQFKGNLPAVKQVVKVDDYTVDMILSSPNPILTSQLDTLYMMSKKWAEKNNAMETQPASAKELNPGALKADGTGPFYIVSHEPGVKTVFKPNKSWWGKRTDNFDEVDFTTIKSDATRVAALLSGQVDMIEPVPVQAMQKVNDNPGTKVLSAPELRTIFLTMDQKRDQLLFSDVKGKNPFKDVRVRKAFYQAIDINAIDSKLMRGLGQPAALLVTPVVFPEAKDFKRFPYDVAAAKKLMADAGYPNGFSLTMHCPNDRYVNDEAICQAVTTMLARINVKVTLKAIPKAQYFALAGNSGGYGTSFGMLGWTPASNDPLEILTQLLGCRDDKGNGGLFNYGGYCNPKVDALAKQAMVETDAAKRNALLVEAFKITTADVAALPLHQQYLAWGISKKIHIVQRPTDPILFYDAYKD